MVTVQLSRFFKPWLLAADETDGRENLQSVWLDPSGVAVATNGYAMVVCKIDIEGETADWKGTLVPAPFFAAAARRVLKSVSAVTLTIDGDRISALTRDGEISTAARDGQFPDWWRTVELVGRDRENNLRPETNWLTVNPFLLADVARALGADPKDIGTCHLPQQWFKQDSATLICGVDCFALVMPMTAPHERQEAFFNSVVSGADE